MKRNDWKIILATLVFTLLFYQQDAGLNFFIFSIVAALLFLAQNFENAKKPAWIAVAVGSIASGFFVMQYGTPLPIIANVVSLLFLGGISFSASSSLIVAGLHSVYSVLTSIPFMVLDFVGRKKGDTEEKKTNWLSKIALLFFPIIVVIVFFFLYRGANPIFLEFTKNINLDWISLPLVRFIIFSFVVMYGFYLQRVIGFFHEKDSQATDLLSDITEEAHLKSFLGKRLSIANEVYIGTALLLMLNVLIGVVNGLDIAYVWGNMTLPEGMIFSDFLHNSTQMLITSIVLAIAIILFFFRGYLNFYKKNKALKILGFVWIAQNILLIVSTAMRNKMYIDAYSLTHKRLGVYFYLLLCVVGLAITFFKILQKKNNLFLFRKNTWAFYAVLVIASFFNWDNIITDFNIEHSQKQDIVDLDIQYLKELSHVNTAQLYTIDTIQDLYRFYQTSGNGHYESDYYYDDDHYFDNYSYYNSDILQDKLFDILEYKNDKGWQSYCASKEQNYTDLMALNAEGKIKVLDLSNIDFDSLDRFKDVSNIQALNIESSYYDSNIELDKLAFFQELKYLNLSNNYHNDISDIAALPKLEYLNLKGNEIRNYSALSGFPALTHLNISGERTYSEPESFPILSNLKTLDLSENGWTDFTFLAGHERLEELILYNNNQIKHIINFPSLASLAIVDLSYNEIGAGSDDFFTQLAASPEIHTLRLQQNYLTKFDYLVQRDANNRPSAYFENLTSLYLANNSMRELEGIKHYQSLVELNLRDNKLENIEELASLQNVEVLDITSNYAIEDFAPIGKIASLKDLSALSCNIKRIDFVGELSQMTTLNLSGNSINTIDTLSALSNLENLNLSNNGIANIDALAQLSQLSYLNLSGNTITDWTPLYHLKNLEKLDVGFLSDEEFFKLQEALPDTEIVNYTKFRKSL